MRRSFSLFCSMVFVLFCPMAASADTLDQLLSKFHKCHLPPDFFYAPWDTARPGHPYLRKLTPYKHQDGLYYFKVKDSLFGLPVSGLIAPGTRPFHGVVFDVPMKEAQTVLRRRFGTTFPETKKSLDYRRPALGAPVEDRSKSILYCELSDPD